MNVNKIARRLILAALILSFGSVNPNLAEAKKPKQRSSKAGKMDPKTRVVYPEKTDIDFEGLALEGEVRNPGEFYFQHRPEEKFDSLVKRRKNFHREMLRDVVLSK